MLKIPNSRFGEKDTKQMISKGLKYWLNSFSGLTRNMWVLAVLNLMNRVGSMVIAFLPIYLTEVEKLTLKQSGQVMAMYGIGSLLGHYLGGWLSDKLNFIRVQFYSLLANGLVLIGMGYVHSYWGLVAIVFLMSFSGDIFRPANSMAVAQFSNDENRTRSFSLVRLAFNLGWTICPALGGVLIYKVGWKYIFWIDGITCILSAIGFWMYFRNYHPQRQKKEVVKTAASLSAYRDSKFIFFVVLTYLGAFCFMQILWTLPLFFKLSLNYNEAQVGSLLAINGLIVALVEMPFIFAIENKRPLYYFIQVGLICYAIAYFAIAFTFAPLAMALVCIVFLSIGEMLVMPFSTNYVTFVAPASHRGQYLALYSIAYAIANTTAPYIGTFMIDRVGYSWFWTFIGTISLCVVVGFNVLKGKNSRTKKNIALDTK